jgi:hypothetical protein
MKKTFLIMLFLFMALMLFNALPCYSTNHMDLFMTMIGVQEWAEYGKSLVTLDFNGDGYCDLAVLESGWQPDSTLLSDPHLRYGRILVYYGGPGFDNIADYTLEGEYNFHLVQVGYNAHISGLGDVNGDGYDDLGINGYTLGTIDTMRPYVAVYFGGEFPSHQPGYYKVFPSLHEGGYSEIEPLGDVNNDGFDDFSICYLPLPGYGELGEALICLGGAMTEVVLRKFNNASVVAIDYVGDVNNDGFDDYTCFFLTAVKTITLYYGSPIIVPADSLVLYSNTTNIVWRTKHLGDINGDSKADFAGLIRYTDICVWYGNEILTPQYNVNLSPTYSGNNNADRGLTYGDFNNDGFADVVGSLPVASGNRGELKIWLGGANMNGTSDLTIYGSITGLLLGTGLTTGDFNGDGFCDIVASAPHCQPPYDATRGRIYIYLGNALLADTTIGVEEDVIEPSSADWGFRVVPNPLPGKNSCKLSFYGTGYKHYQDLSIRIYNLKGQKVRTINISSAQLKAGEVSLPNLKLPTGIYEISLFSSGNMLKSQKVTIK